MQDVNLDGLQVKKGELVGLTWYGPFRNSRLYENPEAFNSDRFMAKNDDKIDQFSWTPFSAGPR